MNKPKEPESGVLVILSAPSGCGKTTVVDRLLKRHPDWIRSVSVTTRAPRSGEKSGEDYRFLSPDEFKKLDESGALLESAKVFDQYYGTPKAFVVEALSQGKTVILAIDVQGMRKIKKALENKTPLYTVFILPPSIKVLRERLEGRKTDAPEEIERRIAAAQEEIKDAKLYDVTVMNKNLEQTVVDVESFIAEKQKGRRISNHALRSS